MKENAVFYVSSRGSSACTWLGKVLSRHPRIVAFSGVRALPPGNTWAVADMRVQDFMAGLHACAEFTKQEKIFGGIHGFYGACAKKPCEALGGLFSYITRHPVTRIGSYFTYTAGNHFNDAGAGVPNQDVLARLAAPANAKEGEELLEIFLHGLSDFFKYERELFDACGAEAGFRMESMVSDREYFAKVVMPLVAPSVEVSQEYLDSIFKVGRIGVHRHAPVSWTETWAMFSPRCQELFLEYFHKYGMKEICDAFGYDVGAIL